MRSILTVIVLTITGLCSAQSYRVDIDYFLSNDVSSSNASFYNILPVNISGEEQFHLTLDQEGNPWLIHEEGVYFYTGQVWYPASDRYPYIPEHTSQLFFPSEGGALAVHVLEDLSLRLSFFSEDRWQFHSDIPNSTRFFNQFIMNVVDNVQLSTTGLIWSRSSIRGNIHYLTNGTWETLDLSGSIFPARTLEQFQLSASGKLVYRTEEEVFVNNGFETDRYSFPGLESLGILWQLHPSDDDRVWMKMGSRLRMWDGDNDPVAIDPIEGYFGDAGPPVHYVHSANDIWQVHRRGWDQNLFVEHYDGEGWTELFEGEMPEVIGSPVSVLRLANGDLWVKHERGISRIRVQSLPLREGNTKDASLAVWPNPACCYPTISWENTAQQRVQLHLYNQQGSLVRTLVDEEQEIGAQSFTLFRRELPGGLYLLRLQQGEKMTTQQLFLH